MTMDADMTTDRLFDRIKYDRYWPGRSKNPVIPVQDIVDNFIVKCRRKFEAWTPPTNEETTFNLRVKLHFYILMLYDIMRAKALSSNSKKIRQAFATDSSWWKKDKILLLTLVDVADPKFNRPFLNSIHEILMEKEGTLYRAGLQANLAKDFTKALKGFKEDYAGHADDLQEYLFDVTGGLDNLLESYKAGYEKFKDKWDREMMAIEEHMGTPPYPGNGEVNLMPIQLQTVEGVIADVIKDFNINYSNNETAELMKAQGVEEYSFPDAHDAVLLWARNWSKDNIVYASNEGRMDISAYECGPWVSGLLYACLVRVRKKRQSRMMSEFVSQADKDKIAHNIFALKERELLALQRRKFEVERQRDDCIVKRSKERTDKEEKKRGKRQDLQKDAIEAARQSKSLPPPPAGPAPKPPPRQPANSLPNNASRNSSPTDSSQPDLVPEPEPAKLPVPDELSDEEAEDMAWLADQPLQDLVLPVIIDDNDVELKKFLSQDPGSPARNLTREQVREELIERMVQEQPKILHAIIDTPNYDWDRVPDFQFMSSVQLWNDDAYQKFIDLVREALRRQLVSTAFE